MLKLKSKTGFVVAGIYLSLVVAAALYAAYRLNFSPANSEFSGMPLILLTLPWSVAALSRWATETLAGVFAVLLLCALANAVILYFLTVLVKLAGQAKLK